VGKKKRKAKKFLVKHRAIAEKKAPLSRTFAPSSFVYVFLGHWFGKTKVECLEGSLAEIRKRK